MAKKSNKGKLMGIIGNAVTMIFAVCALALMALPMLAQISTIADKTDRTSLDSVFSYMGNVSDADGTSKGALVMFILVAIEYTKVLWWIGLVAGASGLLYCWISALFVYGFGELIDKQTEIAENTATIAENTATKGKQPTEKYNYYANPQEQQFDSDDLPNI